MFTSHPHLILSTGFLVSAVPSSTVSVGRTLDGLLTSDPESSLEVTLGRGMTRGRVVEADGTYTHVKYT